MPSLKINVLDSSGTKGFALAGDWIDDTFDEMVSELPDVLTKSLSTAGYILKESVKESFATRMPAANRPFRTTTPKGKPVTSKGGYQITVPDKLVDAAKQSKKNESHVTVFMGSGKSHSPLFIARMYENDSKPRYVKTRNGKKLNPRKYVGKLTGVHYWDSGISAGENEALEAMERIISKNLENTLNN